MCYAKEPIGLPYFRIIAKISFLVLKLTNTSFLKLGIEF